jgi:hypothetical protein
MEGKDSASEHEGWQMSDPSQSTSASARKRARANYSTPFIILTVLSLLFLSGVIFYTIRLVATRGYATPNFLITYGISILLFYVTWKIRSRFRNNSGTEKTGAPLRGVVTAFKESTQGGGGLGMKQKRVWNFRISCYSQGQLVRTIPVQMVGYRFEGSIDNGDEVEVQYWSKGKLLITSSVKNLTSGITVRASNLDFGQTIGWLMFLIAIAAVAYFAIFGGNK